MVESRESKTLFLQILNRLLNPLEIAFPSSRKVFVDCVVRAWDMGQFLVHHLKRMDIKDVMVMPREVKTEGSVVAPPLGDSPISPARKGIREKEITAGIHHEINEGTIAVNVRIERLAQRMVDIMLMGLQEQGAAIIIEAQAFDDLVFLLIEREARSPVAMDGLAEFPFQKGFALLDFLGK